MSHFTPNHLGSIWNDAEVLCVVDQVFPEFRGVVISRCIAFHGVLVVDGVPEMIDLGLLIGQDLIL